MNKRDFCRALGKGRIFILIAAVLCGIIGGGISILRSRPEDKIDIELPEKGGEYLIEAEEFKAVIKEALSDPQLSEETRAKLENVEKYQLASVYGEILNHRCAKDLAEVIKTFEQKQLKAESEAEALNALAWQSYNNALSCSEENYPAMMEEYVKNAELGAEKTFEGEYYENIVRLMSDETVKAGGDAEEKLVQLRAAVEAAYKTERKPAAYEAWGLLGFAVGGILAAAITVIVEFLIISGRMKKQRKAQNESKYGEIADKINFR